MAQYQVPQFIEVEDKIFGPLTLRQFIYIAGAAGSCLALFTVLPLWLAVPLMIPPTVLGLALAFYQINGRPFIIALEHAFGYYVGSKLYLWKQRQGEAAAAAPAEKPVSVLPVPKLSESKLKDLSWSLNIKDRAQMGVKSQAPTGFEI